MQHVRILNLPPESNRPLQWKHESPTELPGKSLAIIYGKFNISCKYDFACFFLTNNLLKTMELTSVLGKNLWKWVPLGCTPECTLHSCSHNHEKMTKEANRQLHKSMSTYGMRESESELIIATLGNELTSCFSPS